jgi:predicted small secreted protein
MDVRRFRWAMGVLLTGLILSCGACNTVEGTGRDIEAGGEALQKAADRR